MVAEYRLRTGCHIFKANLPLLANEVLGHARDIARRLLRETREGAAFGFGLDHTAELVANEQAIVHRTGGRLEFANRNSQPGAKIYFRPGLDQPSTRGKPPVDQ